jgi:hypothetical protein
LKIRADEHVSKEIVRAVREMALTPGWQFDHVAEAGDRGAGDVHWITKFAQQGGNAILSADTDFLKRHHQVLAVQKTGMRVIHLPNRWSMSRCELQAAHILLWWKRVEACIGKMGARECYKAPWNINEDGEMQKQTIDFHDAERKAKRDEKRANKGKEESTRP